MSIPYGKLLLHALLGATSCLLIAAAPQVQKSTSGEVQREYRIKSAFLYHFLHYGAWEGDTTSDEGDLVVCVAGDLPYAAAVETLSAKRLNDRAVTVRHLKDADDSDDAGECRIAFFPASLGAVPEQTLHRLQERGILTVGESAEFTNRGGMIRLYKHRNRLRFEINLNSVRSAGIHMSSRVLRLATIV